MCFFFSHFIKITYILSRRYNYSYQTGRKDSYNQDLLLTLSSMSILDLFTKFLLPEQMSYFDSYIQPYLIFAEVSLYRSLLSNLMRLWQINIRALILEPDLFVCAYF